ncbi:Ppx/GppA family phosphatase [uncultured Sanguibacteroides sp.]|uniref:Ppx/GppA phosphatase family protein n=1 Tax=uncultured Sanguibacteroides sp. TaxID=1635151 RepID=UPI0025EA4A5B|nr:Ppx/GppA family phosphatase [uncultured Sanguibacteroides sp.]
MSKVNYAAIDIGSNAVRLLIKSINTESLVPLSNKEQLVRIPLRLGEDTFSKGEISEEKGKKLQRLMKAYRQLMKIYDVKKYRACATSAVRDAVNGKELIKEISRKSGIQIEIINGEEEARLIYDNHIEELLDKNTNYIYVDVGGGSTEISLIHEGKLKNSRSYNIGTVRLLEGSVKKEVYSRLRRDLSQFNIQYSDIQIIGSGGNINKLFRLARTPEKNNIEFPVEELRRLNAILKTFTTEERMRKFNLRPDRADVITHAADIFLEIADQTASSLILVPTIGLVDGIIDNLYTQDQEQSQE